MMFYGLFIFLLFLNICANASTHSSLEEIVQPTIKIYDDNIHIGDTMKIKTGDNTTPSTHKMELTTIQSQLQYSNKFKPINLKMENTNDENGIVTYLNKFGIFPTEKNKRFKKQTNKPNEDILESINEKIEELKRLNFTMNVSQILDNKTTIETTVGGDIEDALNESFGGSSDIDKRNQNTLPNPKKNGFYFLSDWNSFLEVGDGDEKITVRLNKTIGDPSLFIPLNVP